MKLRGSFTVEASWVISIAFCLLAFVIVTGFEMFSDSVAYVTAEEQEVDYVSLFQKGALAEELLEMWGLTE